MENLKNTINKTETLLNNVKTAKDKINETVVRGSITSKSLSDIPDNIKSMISKNYKKIAIINTNTTINTLTPPNTGRAWRKWSLSLSFTPSLIIMIGTDDGHDEALKRPLTIVSNRDTEQKIHIYENINQNAFIGIRNITKDGFEYLFESYAGATSRIIQIIAIE